jgi:hypothetical protein
MTYYKVPNFSAVETLELVDNTAPDLQLVPVDGGDGADHQAHIHGAALFYPGYHMQWLMDTYWRDPHMSPGLLAPSTESDEPADEGYRLPIIWGSSSRQ